MKRHRLTTVIAATALMLGSLACGAAQAAQTVTTTPYLPYGNPALAGAAVALLNGRLDMGSDVTLNERGQPARQLLTIPAAMPPPGPAVELLASASRVVVGLTHVPAFGDPSVFSYSFSVLEGPLSGPLSEHGRSCPSGSIAVSGPSISYPSPDCDGAVIDDYSANPPTSMALPPGAHDVQLAGQYAAWLAPTDQPKQNAIIVYDRRARSILYRIPPSTASVSDRVTSLALQDDGKLAISYDVAPDNTSNSTQVAWASPTQPGLHVVSHLAAPLIYVKLDRDQLAVLSVRYPAPGRSPLQTLSASDLAGTHQRTIAQPAGGFDEKDGELAWTLPGCLNATIRTASSTDPTADFASLRHCHLGLSAHVLRFHGRRSRVSVRLSCRGLSAGCHYGEIVVRSPSRHGRNGRLLAHGVSTTGGAVVLALTRSGSRLLALHQRLAVSVIATRPDAGAPRRARATLLAG